MVKISMGPGGSKAALSSSARPERRLVPEGVYVCKLASVKEGKDTIKGDQTWNLGFVILEGEYEDQWINDRLIFSERALPRLIKFMGMAGMRFPDDNFELEMEHIRGRVVRVETEIRSYRDRATGETKRYNSVPYAGYFPASEDEIGHYQKGYIPEPGDDPDNVPEGVM